MSRSGPTPIYLFNQATANGTSAVIDCSAFTRKSSIQIIITGTATVDLQGTLDFNASYTWVSCGGTYNGGTSPAWVTIPENVVYLRAVISGYSSGTVTVLASRGIADDAVSVLSAQNPVAMSSGTTGN